MKKILLGVGTVAAIAAPAATVVACGSNNYKEMKFDMRHMTDPSELQNLIAQGNSGVSTYDGVKYIITNKAGVTKTFTLEFKGDTSGNAKAMSDLTAFETDGLY